VIYSLIAILFNLAQTLKLHAYERYNVYSFVLEHNTAWVRTRLCKLQKGYTRLAAASDKVYQLLAHGRWFSPGTPASSITKTDRHDIAEILLKVTLSTINKSMYYC
jgi:hypothetical protein